MNRPAQEWLKLHHWAVVGDVLNPDKYAHVIVQALEKEGYAVTKINPRSHSPLLYRQLADAPDEIDVIDLVIHPRLGLKVMEQALQLGIRRVVVQPGAESDALLAFCRANGIEAVEDCVLRALANE